MDFTNAVSGDIQSYALQKKHFSINVDKIYSLDVRLMQGRKDHVDGCGHSCQMKVVKQDRKVIVKTSRRVEVEPQDPGRDALDGRLRRRRDVSDASATTLRDARRVFAVFIKTALLKN